MSRAIKWINVSYAAYFNRKRHRRGHLFQGRFKSILVDADEYLKHLSRYIHLNPLRAKMVEALSEYAWSSYPAFIGKAKVPVWLESDWLLGLFGNNRKAAAKNYRDFVEKVDVGSLEDPGRDLAGGFILGGVEFVNWVKESFLSKRSAQKEVPQLKALRPKLTPAAIVATVCQAFGCNVDHVLQKGRKKNTARDVAIYLARELTGVSGVDLGKYFGNISGAGITVRYNHMAGKIAENRRLKGRVKHIRKQIINN